MDHDQSKIAAADGIKAVEQPSSDQTGRASRLRRKPDYVPDDPLLNAAEAAMETGRALSTFWRDVRAGALPGAYYVTPRSPRWRRSELRASVEACRAPAASRT